MVPHRTPFFLPWFFPSSLVWSMPAGRKEIYLTFDDGPVTGPTEFVLNVLEEHQIKATFFCIGDNIRKHPHIFQRILDEGHRAGNHTFNHMNGWKTPLEDYLKNVALCQSEMDKFPVRSAVSSMLFRPPYGKITRRQARALGHCKTIMWDVLSGDYDKRISPENCLRNTVRATRPGSIVIFHDSVKAERNMTYALPQYIRYCLDEGFVFKSLP